MQATRFGEAGIHARRRSAAFGALMLALTAGTVSYAPALRAYFAQDDFAFLALVRLLHAPWLLFAHDHFPASLYFRPLGVLTWWLVCAFADAQAWPQYALNLLLHLGCVAALYALLERLRSNAWVNALWAALYAVHPLAVGTALWLSDRFDLLTTLFSLLATNAALAYVARPSTRTLAALLFALLAALLSKELGVVAAAATFALVALAPRLPLTLRARSLALVAIAALSGTWLVYRHLVLTPIPGASAALIPLATFAAGGWRWLHTGAEFLAGDPRMPVWGTTLLAIACLLWTGAALAARRGLRREPPRWHVAAAIATLALLPGLVQAPVAVRHLGDIDAQSYWFALIVASRFYHLSLAGLIVALMLVSAPLVAHGALSRGPRLALAVALLLSCVALAPAANAIARDYAARSRELAGPLVALEQAIARADLPAQHCQVYLLAPAGLWGLAGYSDALVKGLATDPERVAHCLFSTERPAYTYFVRRASVSAEDYAPLLPLALAGGQQVPWLTIGDVQAMYFAFGEGIAAQLPPTALFFEYRDGKFDDVSAAVRAGQRTVPFVVSKPN